MSEYSEVFARRSDKGQEAYYDLITILPEPLKYEPKMMYAAQLMQDYLNGGYRKLPSPDYKYPLNHSHDDAFYSYAERVGIEYVKDRDIGTWAIPDSKISEYKAIYSAESKSFRPDVAWPNKNIYLDYITYLVSNGYNYNDISSSNRYTYYTTSNWNKVSMLDFNNTYEEFKNLQPLVATVQKPIKLDIYLRQAEIEDNIIGQYNGSLYINDSQYINTSMIPDNIYSAVNKVTILANSYMDLYDTLVNSSTSSFVEYIFSGSDVGRPKTNCHITVYDDPSNAVAGIPVIVPEIIKIYEWQEPNKFYNHFVGQYDGADTAAGHINNIIDPSSTEQRFEWMPDGSISYRQVEVMYSGHNSYRHESDYRSLREKIARLAYSHDPEIIDFDYIQLVASQMGYDIDISIEDLQDNYYSTNEEDRNNMVRELIRNMPYFNKMKTTKNALELIFLSMGIVAQIINLYTYGKYEGFVDKNIIENAASYNSFNGWDKSKYNRALAVAPLKDWFPSPHFYIKIDLTSGYLGQNDIESSLSNMIYKMMKIVKNSKPDNAVFKGFSIIQKVFNVNSIYINGTSCKQVLRQRLVGAL